MTIVSWNVNGLRASIRRGFFDIIAKIDADIIVLQEVKTQRHDLEEIKYYFEKLGYNFYYNCADRAGYSGTAIASKQKPQKVTNGVGHHLDSEGRIITTEFDEFIIINGYLPFSRSDLSRLSLKTDFNNRVYEMANDFRIVKPVILCGDLNVAPDERDVHKSARFASHPGYTDSERKGFKEFLKEGFHDAFRMFNQEAEHYTWYSYFSNSRKKKNGWRLDYFLVSEELRKEVISCSILKYVTKSDHVPIVLKLRGV